MRTCVPASAHSAVCSDRRTERETQDLQLKTWGFVLSKNHGVWRHRGSGVRDERRFSGLRLRVQVMRGVLAPRRTRAAVISNLVPFRPRGG